MEQFKAIKLASLLEVFVIPPFLFFPLDSEGLTLIGYILGGITAALGIGLFFYFSMLEKKKAAERQDNPISDMTSNQ